MIEDLRTTATTGVTVDGKSSEQDLIVPNGTERWKSTSQLLNGDDLWRISAYDTRASKFSQFVKVEHDKAFILKPLTLMSGPLKGCHVLMLDTSLAQAPSPSTCFRFLDLAKQIRYKVYEILLSEKTPIKISAFAHRPVREGYGYETKEKHLDSEWSPRQAKWADQPPSNFAILGVSKKIHSEAASIAYGNEFSFAHPNYFKLFVRTSGSMCKYIKHIEFLQTTFCSENRYKSPFRLVLELSNLRTLKIKHSAFYGYPIDHRSETWRGTRTDLCGVADFVEGIKEPLGMFNFIHGGEGSELNVLNIFQVTVDRCRVCIQREQEREGYRYRHPRLGLSSVEVCTCDKLRTHRFEMEIYLQLWLKQALKAVKQRDDSGGVAVSVDSDDM